MMPELLQHVQTHTHMCPYTLVPTHTILPNLLKCQVVNPNPTQILVHHPQSFVCPGERHFLSWPGFLLVLKMLEGLEFMMKKERWVQTSHASTSLGQHKIVEGRSSCCSNTCEGQRT